MNRFKLGILERGLRSVGLDTAIAALEVLGVGLGLDEGRRASTPLLTRLPRRGEPPDENRALTGDLVEVTSPASAAQPPDQISQGEPPREEAGYPTIDAAAHLAHAARSIFWPRTRRRPLLSVAESPSNRVRLDGICRKASRRRVALLGHDVSIS